MVTRGHPADRMKPVVREAGRLGKIHFVAPETSQIGTCLQTGVSGAERSLGASAVGDIHGDAHQAHRLAGRREMRTPAGRQPPNAAITKPDAVFHVYGLTCLGRPLEAALSPHAGWTATFSKLLNAVHSLQIATAGQRKRACLEGKRASCGDCLSCNRIKTVMDKLRNCHSLKVHSELMQAN